MRRGPPASALAALRLAAPVAAATALGATPGAAFSSLALGALLRIDSVARVRRPSVYFAAAAAAAVGFAAVEFLWVGRATAGGFARGLVYAGLAAAGPFLGPGEPRSVTLAEPLGPFESRLKRAFDLAFVAAGALPALLVAACVRAARDPIWRHGFFFRQIRTGLHGRLIRVAKIRTMAVDAEADGRPRWSERADASISRTGRVLRRLWLDELPQLWDVWVGRMSLVGPRPERPEFVEGLALRLPKYAVRLSVPPGVTGLAQLLGFAGDTSLRRRLVCDRLYVRRWSPWLDFRLLAGTALKALLKGARRSADFGRGRAK
jgi:lipopolysaccharide/colanic/teichoic acid biosynthesis glycosyltransferase